MRKVARGRLGWARLNLPRNSGTLKLPGTWNPTEEDELREGPQKLARENCSECICFQNPQPHSNHDKNISPKLGASCGTPGSPPQDCEGHEQQGKTKESSQAEETGETWWLNVTGFPGQNAFAPKDISRKRKGSQSWQQLILCLGAKGRKAVWVTWGPTVCHPSVTEDKKMNETLAQSPAGEANMQKMWENINREREKLLFPRAREGFRGTVTSKRGSEGWRGVHNEALPIHVHTVHSCLRCISISE